jgi:hypothetical protein
MISKIIIYTFGERFGQHINAALHHVHWCASLWCFLIQRCAWVYKICDIGNIYYASRNWSRNKITFLRFEMGWLREHNTQSKQSGMEGIIPNAQNPSGWRWDIRIWFTKIQKFLNGWQRHNLYFYGSCRKDTHTNFIKSIWHEFTM